MREDGVNEFDTEEPTKPAGAPTAEEVAWSTLIRRRTREITIVTPPPVM